MLFPWRDIKSTLWVLEPNKFTLISVTICTSSDEVFAAVSIQVDPISHVIEEVFLGWSNLNLGSGMGDIIIRNTEHINSSVCLTRWDKTIWDMDSPLSKDIAGYNLNVIWPCKVVSKLVRFQVGCIITSDSIFDVWDNINISFVHCTKG